MNTLFFTLALAYAKTPTKDKTISIMLYLCVLGIAIGTFSLMVSLAIMRGFEVEICQKIKGINADITITHPTKHLNAKALEQKITSQLRDVSVSISPSSIRTVLLDHDGNQHLLFIRSIKPAAEEAVSNLSSKIIHQNVNNHTPPSLPTLLQGDSILIGEKLADEHSLSTHDTITLLIPGEQTSRSLSFSKTSAQVSGIFKFGMDEYDANCAYISADFFEELFGEHGSDSLALRITKAPKSLWHDPIATVKEQLQTTFPGFTIKTWREINPELVSSLVLEKYAMFIIIALITLVASMNMISLLFIQIQTKRRDIAIFKALGMPHSMIKNIFLSIGMIVTLLGTSIGLGLGALCCYILEKYPFIKLPDVYYVSYLPARSEPLSFLIVFGVTLVLGFFATWIAVRKTRSINVVDVLRSN